MKDANFSECKFSAEIVSYMYDELSSSQRFSFEQHLVDCSECTDEFAAISSARFEVYDWKKLEFDPLETPSFEIPIAEVSGVSWSDRIRAVFAQRWAVPTISFATLAIVAIVTAGVILRQGDTKDIVSGPTTVTAPAKEEVSVPVPNNVPTRNMEKATESKAPIERTTTRASVPTRVTPKRSAAQTVRATRQRPVDVKQTTARNGRKPFPTLSDYPDDEDTSLRLAELLDDIGSR
jgi:hypothetical protein